MSYTTQSHTHHTSPASLPVSHTPTTDPQTSQISSYRSPPRPSRRLQEGRRVPHHLPACVKRQSSKPPKYSLQTFVSKNAKPSFEFHQHHRQPVHTHKGVERLKPLSRPKFPLLHIVSRFVPPWVIIPTARPHRLFSINVFLGSPFLPSELPFFFPRPPVVSQSWSWMHLSFRRRLKFLCPSGQAVFEGEQTRQETSPVCEACSKDG